MDFDKILIVGKNAQGKTNILESIYFLSALKSPRTPNNLELINFDSESVEINAEVEKSDTQIELDFNYDKAKKREIKVNKLKTRPKEFKSVLKTVLFSTQDLMLLRGSPQDRRDWLDGAISQIYPAYEDRLSKYNKIRIQKNNFLKDYRQNDALFDVYNEQLSILGSNIIYLRKKYLNDIEQKAKEKYAQISGGEELSINYDCNFLSDENYPSPQPSLTRFAAPTGSLASNLSGSLCSPRGEGELLEVEEILEKFHKKLDERRKLEIIKQQSLVGPHRDDVVFCINGEEATKFASQGQQRSVVLSLKLAELDIITSKSGQSPVLLLDDVLAELDDLRQNYLLNTIDINTQTIITSVDTLLFDKQFLKTVQLYRVEKGTIVL